MTVIGWDIGGVNIKAARVHANAPLAARNDPFEIQRAPATLAARLEGIATALGAEKADVHAITMTAELSQFFRTKRDGVVYVLDAVERAFPAAHTFAYTVDGRFLDPAAARQSSLLVAASNWTATASLVATLVSDAVLIDVPCTGTGTFRRHPDARWRLKVSDLAVMSALQKTILRAAAKVVRRDGLLIYSTCSLEPEENDAQVDAFLAENLNWVLEAPPEGAVSGDLLDGGRLRVLPQRHGADGAFAARLRRVS